MVIRTLIKFLLIILISVSAGFLVYRTMQPQSNLLFENSDYEQGSLKNWHAEGSAFINQPTLGDNPLKRGLPLPTKFQGNYWIGTYEKRPAVSSPEGGIQGNSLVGKLTSIPFVIRENKIAFLSGAGTGKPETSISLVINGKTVLAHTPNAFLINSEELTPVTWDVTPWRKKKAIIVIVDQASEGWGHINVDDFHYE